MALTINSAAPTAVHRSEFAAAFHPGATLNASASLAWPAAAGVQHEVNSASAVTITLPAGAIPLGAVITGVSTGAGAVSFAAGSGETIVASAILPATAAQYDPFEFRRVSGNRWVRVA